MSFRPALLFAGVFVSLLARFISSMNRLTYFLDCSPCCENFYPIFLVIYHVAPLMDSEQHRRLIGNVIGIIFVLEVGAKFDLRVLDGLGTVPQVFAIVQPFKNKYRLTFLNRLTLRPYEGLIPKGYLFDETEMKDRLLAKRTLLPHVGKRFDPQEASLS